MAFFRQLAHQKYPPAPLTVWKPFIETLRGLVESPRIPSMREPTVFNIRMSPQHFAFLQAPSFHIPLG